jgi:sec-independent protein translocase protein TatC
MLKENQRVDLISHLTELRSRLVRSFIYIGLGSFVVWTWYDPMYSFVLHPLLKALEASKAELNYQTVFDPFMIKFQISMVGGVILAVPFLFWEVWAFVAPGLTARERRTIRPVIPASGVLFLMGVALAYLITQQTVNWLMGFRAPHTRALLDFQRTVLIILKFYLAFGLAFQLPVVIVILASLGIVDSRLLTVRWREASVLIFVIAAVITPTWDMFTMTIAALPMVVLYFATIGVVKVIERKRRRTAMPAELRAQ